MLEEQHREGEKSDWVWLPHTANSILGTLVRVRIGDLIGGAQGDSRNGESVADFVGDVYTEITVNHNAYNYRIDYRSATIRRGTVPPPDFEQGVLGLGGAWGSRAPGRPAWRSNVVWVPTHRESLVPTILQGCRSETMVKTVRTARRRRTQ